MLKIENLSASYGKIRVLWDVSLRVDSSEIIALIGANGAGKSTLFKSIMGLIRPTGGTITYDGGSLTGLTPHRVVSKGVGYVPEGRRIFPGMTVEQNLRMGAPRRSGDMESRFENVYGLFPVLTGKRTQLVGTMSGGEQQMVAIGRALMSKPSLLLLDELSLGLSPILFDRVMEAIREIRASGVAILMSEQNYEKALGASNRAYLIENGRITDSDESRKFLQNPRIREAYLGGAG